MTYRSSPLKPLCAWSDLAAETGEMLVAAAQVIGHRTGRMALAGPLPSARDQAEFTLMVQEKVEAAALSAVAVGAQWMSLGSNIGLRTWRDMCAATTASLALAASRTPKETAARQARLARTLTRSAASVEQLGDAGARIARHGLKPIHAKATANAKRLARG